jgi:hypothetical protein
LNLVSILKRESLFNFGSGRNGTFLSDAEVGSMDATFWAKEQFFLVSGLGQPEPAPKPFDGLDHLLFLSWIRRKLSDTDAQPFVWQYWDLRPPNIMLDEENNLIAYVALKFSN